LKARDPMRWVRLMNALKVQAEEIIQAACGDCPAGQLYDLPGGTGEHPEIPVDSVFWFC